MSSIVSEFNNAVFLEKNGDLKKAKKILKEIISLKPDHFESIFLLSIINYKLRLFQDALKYNNLALNIRPNFLQCYNNRSIILKKLKKFDEALVSINKAISLNPNFAEFYNNQANILKEIKKFDEALVSINKAISLNPNFAEFYNNLGIILQDLRRHEEAIISFNKALNINSNIPFIKGRLLYSKMSCCSWSNIHNLYKDIYNDVEKGIESADPFGYQAICTDENNLRLCAEIYSHKYFPENINQHKKRKIVKKSKINIAYLCGEFREQATSILLTEIWESHNKNIFKTFALDNGWDDNSPRRKRIKNSFDEFIDISKLSDDSVVRLIKEKNIHVLVNLNGFFGLGRQNIFACRAARIQINFLGFPGTFGAKYIDYLIADQVVIPFESQKYYSEKIIYLPDCYQPGDTKRVKSSKLFKREQFDLPKSSFVFACFNNSYKITPEIFDCWMKILQAVDKSVLWLIETEEIVCKNLKLEASKKNIDPSNIIFTKRMKLDDHLSRHDLADLFLDTLPYNAHTTANDSLWAGLPVLTCLGKTFPGKVGASLLRSVGLSDLITFSMDEYINRAVYFGNNPHELAKVKDRLNKNKFSYPLFNSKLYTKNLEKVFIELYKRHF